MNIKMAAVLIVIALLIGGTFAIKLNRDRDNGQNISTELESTSEQEIHLHAGFQVYKSGKLVDFSSAKYMHLETCDTEDHEEVLDAEEELEERAHLHNFIGDVVHVHRAGAVWENLFENISYNFEGDVVGYINGTKVENILDQGINAYDSVVIFEGERGDVENELSSRVSREYIVEVEKTSESCGVN